MGNFSPPCWNTGSNEVRSTEAADPKTPLSIASLVITLAFPNLKLEGDKVPLLLAVIFESNASVSGKAIWYSVENFIG